MPIDLERKKDMGYRHIVFDIDGTLTDTDFAVLSSLRDLIERHQGRTLVLADLYFVMGFPGTVAFERLGFARAEFDALMREWEDGMRARNDTIRVYAGVPALLQALHDAGVGLGIATSKPRDQYEKDFCRFDIARFFPVSVTCDETDDPKPGAGPLRAYMEKTGAAPEEMLYVGDSVYDAMTAQAAGVDFALAMWGTTMPEVAAKYRPDTPLDLLAAAR